MDDLAVGRLGPYLLQSFSELSCTGGSEGQISCSIYDTAMLATLRYESRQLFSPESIIVIVKSQLATGAWPATPHDDTGQENILATLAALYCLLVYRRVDSNSNHLHRPIERGTLRARELLNNNQQLSAQSVSVGFDVLIPEVLRLLRDEGTSFVFERQERIFTFQKFKLTQFRTGKLYDSPSNLQYSAKGFLGIAALRRLHRSVGDNGLMASPSATASLFPTGKKYLEKVLQFGEGRGSGAVPGVYPSNIFELLWSIVVLFDTGFWKRGSYREIEEDTMQLIRDAGSGQGGLVGFAPGMAPNLDESSKASVFMNHMGGRGLAGAILERFKSEDLVHLKAHDLETKPSLTSNCNGLRAIIKDQPYSSGLRDFCHTLVDFLCTLFLATDDPVPDNWNLSPLYTTMHIAAALSEFTLWADRTHRASQQVQMQVKCALRHCSAYVLRVQVSDGSWGAIAPKEETAYAMLSIHYLRLAGSLTPDLGLAAKRGHYFLSSDTRENGCLWVDKTPFRSALIARAHMKAALWAQEHLYE